MTHPHRLGVCSWSLQPSDPEELVTGLRRIGVAAVQLALDPLRDGTWDLDATRRALGSAGIEIVSGMMGMEGEDYSTLETIRVTGGVRPDEHWETNRAAAAENARIARELGLDLVTLHAGFIPHEELDGRAEDPLRTTMIERLRVIVDTFAEQGVRVGFETGQETAATLVDALNALGRPEAGVNFDPANMILYGMGDPVAALERLAPRVVQLHIKDARATTEPGTWGEEVTVGTGEVPWDEFFAIVKGSISGVNLCIEREAGDDRVADMQRARELVEGYL